MNSDIKIGVIGGDLRQLVAAMELAEDGYETAVFGFDSYEGALGMSTRCVAMEDAVRSANIIVLPLPYSIDKIHLNTPLSQNEIHLDYLFSLFNEKQVIIGGKFDLLAESLALTQNLTLTDYYKREDLTILNAIPTDSFEGGYTKNRWLDIDSCLFDWYCCHQFNILLTNYFTSHIDIFRYEAYNITKSRCPPPLKRRVSLDFSSGGINPPLESLNHHLIYRKKLI